MKNLFAKWTGISLVLRIVVGLVIGAILGVAVPGATGISILGSVFVGALKAVAPVLVFVLVLSALANASGSIGSRFSLVIGLYMLTTLLASLVAVIGSKLFPVELVFTGVDAATNTAPGGIAEVLGNLLTNMVENPVSALANANYIGILFWAVILGIGVRGLCSEATKAMLQEISDVVSQAVRWVIELAPLGILGLVFTTVSTNGLEIFTSYGKLLALLVGCMLFMALVVSPTVVFLLLRRNPYPLIFRCLRESGITAFFTRSSAAKIPVNMALCEKLGLDKDLYSVSIPLGATINMDGAAITIAVMSLAAANTLNIPVDLPTALILCVLATLSACGASGVAGGSLLLIPMACSLFGIGNDIAMQVVGIGFIIGVVQDSVETALNSSGDVVFAATAEFYDRRKRGESFDF
ncbi:MAG: serine/threonine transporter SstT [Oscillospiraceae bacterium]|nr:serine/threonine transporter SstT [Oscillospiraceae bacterium]